MTGGRYPAYLTARLTQAGYSPDQINPTLLLAEAVNVTLADGRAAAQGYCRPVHLVMGGGHEGGPGRRRRLMAVLPHGWLATHHSLAMLDGRERFE